VRNSNAQEALFSLGTSRLSCRFGLKKPNTPDRIYPVHILVVPRPSLKSSPHEFMRVPPLNYMQVTETSSSTDCAIWPKPMRVCHLIGGRICSVKYRSWSIGHARSVVLQWWRLC